METFHSISWGQHIEKQEIFTKPECNESNFKALTLHQNNLCKESKVGLFLLSLEKMNKILQINEAKSECDTMRRSFVHFITR